MCDDSLSDYAYDYAEGEYRAGYDSGWDAREREIQDLEEDVAALHRINEYLVEVCRVNGITIRLELEN